MTLRVVSRIAIPIGDPNGIGPEIALKTVAAYSGREDVALTLLQPERLAEYLGV